MSRRFVTALGIVLSSSLLPVLGHAQSASSQDQAPIIKATAQEVVLDVVFSDKKGKTIKDIRPDQVHVYEDGVEQKISSFHLFDANAPSAPSGTAQFDPMREVRLVTFVSEGLDLDGQRFFRQSMKDVLDMTPEQNLYFSIMAIDQNLHVIQPFTADHAALMKAAEKSATWSFLQYNKQNDVVKSELKQTIAQSDATSMAAGPQGLTAGQIQSYVNYKMAKMQYDMMQGAASADRSYDARNTLDALLALVRAEAELPGRKVVLYFNPFLFIPESVKEEYQMLVSTANRANVSFYTVDPKGLVTWDQNGMGVNTLGGANNDTRGAQMAGASGGDKTVSAGQARAVENAENAQRLNPLLWLRDLSQQTGGITIAETNDTKAPLRAAMNEVRTYYELTYAPKISTFDGKFRKLLVKVDQPDVIVHARSGYFALPSLRNGEQLNAYEMPLLNALNTPTSSTDLPFEAAAERFDDRGPKVEYMVTLEAPLKGITFQPQADQKTAALDAALLAVVKDSNGEIVEKFSKDFAVQVPLDSVEAHKGGDLVQTFHTELAPGTYSFEAVLMDRKNNKIGVKKSTLVVPAPSHSLSMSDVVIVRSTQPMKDSQMLDAFYFPGGKVVPSLDDKLAGGAGHVLPFYFTVYPDSSSKDAPKLTMAFYKGGQYLGAAEAPLPPVQKDGRIPYIANLPADKFSPGSYEIQIGVVQGSAKAQEKVAFQVQ